MAGSSRPPQNHTIDSVKAVRCHIKHDSRGSEADLQNQQPADPAFERQDNMAQQIFKWLNTNSSLAERDCRPCGWITLGYSDAHGMIMVQRTVLYADTHTPPASPHQLPTLKPDTAEPNPVRDIKSCRV